MDPLETRGQSLLALSSDWPTCKGWRIARVESKLHYSRAFDSKIMVSSPEAILSVTE